MAKTINIIAQTENQDTISSRCFPTKGVGKRAMDCKMYDKCLYKAAIEDWDSFDCEWCEYEAQGTLSLIDPVLRMEYKELELIFEEDLKNGLVNLFPGYTYKIKSNLL